MGRNVTLLWVLWESGRKIWDTFEWAEQLEADRAISSPTSHSPRRAMIPARAP